MKKDWNEWKKLYNEFAKDKPKTKAHFRQERWENDYQAKNRFELAKGRYESGMECDTTNWLYQPIKPEYYYD
jgi:hypothetical protein